MELLPAPPGWTGSGFQQPGMLPYPGAALSARRVCTGTAPVPPSGAIRLRPHGLGTSLRRPGTRRKALSGGSGAAQAKPRAPRFPLSQLCPPCEALSAPELPQGTPGSGPVPLTRARLGAALRDPKDMAHHSPPAPRKFALEAVQLLPELLFTFLMPLRTGADT